MGEIKGRNITLKIEGFWDGRLNVPDREPDAVMDLLPDNPNSKAFVFYWFLTPEAKAQYEAWVRKEARHVSLVMGVDVVMDVPTTAKTLELIWPEE